MNLLQLLSRALVALAALLAAGGIGWLAVPVIVPEEPRPRVAWRQDLYDRALAEIGRRPAEVIDDFGDFDPANP